MDLWVVAAATGAGYLAKYWQNLSGEKHSLAESSSLLSINRQSDLGNVLQQIPDRPHPLQRLARKWLDEDESECKFQETDQYVGWNEDHNVGLLSSMPTLFGGREAFRENVDGIGGKPLISRRPRVNLVKPVEGYGFNVGAGALPSSSTMIRGPLLVTDGSRMISRSNSSDPQFDGGKDKIERENAVCLEENNAFLVTGSMRLPRKPEKRHGKGQLRSISTMESGGRLLLVFIGITIGIMATIVANESEVDYLSELLKQAENLVHDLREELEMKDVLTMKELPTEGNALLGPAVVPPYSMLELHESGDYASKMKNDCKEENDELMTATEAELEAELERLELSIKTPPLAKISDLVELDPVFEADVVEGDLKLDVIGRHLHSPSDSDHDENGITDNPTHDVNYAVSPQELSIRIHEVIESRLRAHIEELEMTLRNSPSQSIDVYNEGYRHTNLMKESNHGNAVAVSNGDCVQKEISRSEIKLSQGQSGPRWSGRMADDNIRTHEDWTLTRGSSEGSQSGEDDEVEAMQSF